MEIKTFIVSIPKRQIEKAYEWLKDQDFTNYSGSYIAQSVVEEGIQNYFHSKGVFTDVYVEGVDCYTDQEGFDGAISAIRKLPKTITFKAVYITGKRDLANGLYLSMVDFKEEAQNLISTLKTDPNQNKEILRIQSDRLIKEIKAYKGKPQTLNEWLSICLTRLYPNVDFIPRSEGDPISKDEMIEALEAHGDLYIRLNKGIAENWIVEGI